MPDLPISGLPAVTTLSGSFITAVVSGSVTSQMTVKQIGDAYSSSISTFPYTGSARITGSLELIGNATLSGSVTLPSNRTLLAGVVTASVLATNYWLIVNGYDGTTGGSLRFRQYTSTVNGFVNTTSIAPVNDDQIGIAFYQTASATYKTINFKNNLISNDTSRTFQFPDKDGTIALLSDTFPYTGSAIITGSLGVTGSLSVSGSITAVNNLSVSRAIIANSAGNMKIGAGSNASTSGTGNIAVGDFALSPIGVGSYNIAIGRSAQSGMTSGSFNVAMGYNALQVTPTLVDSTGNYNTAIGNYSMQYIGQGSYNVAVGHGSLAGVSPFQASASYNVAIGVSASFSASSGTNNITVGYQAGSQITTGNYNTILGSFTGLAGLSNTIVLADGLGNIGYRYSGSRAEITGSLNVLGSVTASRDFSVGGLGYRIGQGGGNDIGNVAHGFANLADNTTGTTNIALGYNSLRSNTAGSSNIAIGYNTMNLGTVTSNNIGIGNSALINLSSTSQYNLALGHNAGTLIDVGNYNTIIGSYQGSTGIMNNNIVLSDGQGNVKFWFNSGSSGLIALLDDTQVTGSLYVSGSITQNFVTNSLVKANANGTLVAAVGGADYTPPAYLAAFHTASLTVPSPNTPNTMSFSTVDFAQGVTISGSWSDKIKVTNGGVYNLQFSAATTKTTGTSATVDIWLRKNENNLSYTNTIVTLAGGANDFAVPAWNFFVSASAGDYYQLMFASPTTNPYIAYSASGSTGIAVEVPSVILTVNRVG